MAQQFYRPPRYRDSDKGGVYDPDEQGADGSKSLHARETSAAAGDELDEIDRVLADNDAAMSGIGDSKEATPEQLKDAEEKGADTEC